MKKTASKFLPLLLWLLLAKAAHAQAEDQQPLDLDQTAAEHFNLGVQAYQAGQWEAARAEFRVCLDLSKRPALLFNLSMVAEKQGKLAEALDLAREFQAKALTPPEKADGAARIAKLEALLKSAPNPTTPTPTPTALVQDQPRSQDQPTSKVPRALTVIGLVGGGSLLVAALGVGIAGSLLKEDLESRPLTLAELDHGRSLAHSYQTATIALGVIGGALVVGGVVIATTSRRRAR